MIDKQFADLPDVYKNQIKFGENVYRASPTATCPTGTRGRIAVAEVFAMDKDLEHVILTNPTEEEIYKLLRSKGMIMMKEDALIKTFNKIVPFEEIEHL